MKCQPVTPVETLDVLVVDADLQTSEIARQTATGRRVRSATSVDQALAALKHQSADVALVNLEINDNAGIALVKSIRQRFPSCQVIAISRGRRGDTCLDAWRAGAVDMLIAPITADDLNRTLSGLTRKRSQLDVLARRNQRLRQVCKQLNKARHDISRQVDLLCNDLVRAYQDMAQQLNLTQLSVDFAQCVSSEIEVEGLLRKTMEWVLQKLGPINAAVYLSDADHRFALGAYLNLDTQGDAELINAIGDTLVRQCDGSAHALALNDDQTIDELFGGEHATRLKGRTWLAAPCYTISAQKRECLAVVVLFRGQSESAQSPSAGPFDPSVRSMLEALAPVLGEKIEQALELYHRMHPEDEEDTGYQPEE